MIDLMLPPELAVLFVPWVGAASEPPSFSPFSTEYTTPGYAATIAIPEGASTVTVECIGGGGGRGWYSDNSGGGGGGGYARKNSYSVAGLTGIYVSVGYGYHVSGGAYSYPSFARENGSGGTVIANATGGYAAPTGSGGAGGAGTVGDVLYTGGTGAGSAGGGAAGPGGNGGAASGSTPGAGNGSPAGDGGANDLPGEDYGGGSGGGTSANGAGGWLKLSWA